jgi:hypothetical protein
MRLKHILIVAAVIVIALGGFFAYVAISIHNLQYEAATQSSKVPLQYLTVSLLSKSQLSYQSGQYLIPYSQVSYTESNISKIFFNSTLFKYPPPEKVFILNSIGNCYECADLSQVETEIGRYLKDYNLPYATSISYVNQQNLSSLPPDSALIILSGAIPLSLLSVNSSNSTPLISQLLSKGVDIIYVGRNFANATSGSILVPVDQLSLPGYLKWTDSIQHYNNSPFYLNTSTFYLSNGTRYGPLSYSNYQNGSILVFPAYLSSWKNASSTASDISKALSQLFWLPKYSSGSTSLEISANNASGIIGLPMEKTYNGYNYSSAASIPAAYAFIVGYTNSTYSISNRSIYRYLSYTVVPHQNGSISLPASIVPGTQQSAIISVITGSQTQISVSPHITIYTLNMSEVDQIPLQPFNASGTFTFIAPLQFDFPPGSYIAEIQGFYNKLYAASLFNISQVSISLRSSNYTSNVFSFFLSSQAQPLSGIPYIITVNNLYPFYGNLTNGTIEYALPSGIPKLTGKVDFNINMLGRNFTYIANNSPVTITISSQYIEIAIVIIVALILVTVVRAPNRDEFYIDTPTIREQKKTQIRIKSTELISAFDKLNLYYHWRYMPLSVSEVRTAISNNIRYGGMPVSLTYSNVERLLSQMVSNGLIVAADGLYAPKTWTSASGHDIEYLATFKKLRVYFVSHAIPFNDIDLSNSADIAATINGERVYMIIHSRTSKFQKIPISRNAKTYIAFLNQEKLDDFQKYIHTSSGGTAEMLRLYLSAGKISLMNADSPGAKLT